jgi:acyl carrier protein
MKPENQLNEQLIFEAIDKSLLLKIPANEAKSHTLNDLGVDSLDLISLSMLFEDELKLIIDIDNLTPTSTLENLISGLQPIKE